jgi:hypothetical protein
MRRIFVVFLAAAFAMGFWFAGPADATHYSGTHTGYAMGNWTGAHGTNLYASAFANHSSSYCGSDPASYWSFGTTIYEDSAISYPEADGSYWSSDVATLEDIGDLYCTMGSYWVDIYFGRWKRSYESCSCIGSDQCSTASNANSCSVAINFGSSSRGYTKN